MGTVKASEITIDGTTAWWVRVFNGAADAYNRPCDTCGGSGCDKGRPNPSHSDCTPCHDCDGTCRHTFTLDVECDEPDIDRCEDQGVHNGPTCEERGCFKGRFAISVHVVEVLPIVEGDLVGVPRPVIHSYPVIAAGKVVTWHYLYAVNGEDDGHIGLPDDAAPGKFCLRLAVHT